MSKGSYIGGSTVIRAGSNWFSKSPATMTEAERVEALREKREQQQKEALARKLAREKADREKAAEKKEKEMRAKKARALQGEAMKRKSDPEYLAHVAAARRKQEERIKKVVFEVKRSKSITPPDRRDGS